MEDLMTMLTPPSEFLAACPKFRLLVLGGPESTKLELFTKVFGVDLEKVRVPLNGRPFIVSFVTYLLTLLPLQRLVDDAFSPDHNIDQELDLHGQNSRLAIHTCLNFATNDNANYDRVRDFFLSRATPSTKQEDRIHCIWYCVASEEGREVAELERRFFSTGLHTNAANIPLILAFTKYDEFVSQVRLDWSRDAQQRGLSKVAVAHILRDLSSKKFEKHIGRKWDEVLNGSIPRVCVSGGDDEDAARSFEELTVDTLARLRERSVKYAFAAAQRNSATISTQCKSPASPPGNQPPTNNPQTAPTQRRSTSKSTRATRANCTASTCATSSPTSSSKPSSSSTCATQLPHSPPSPTSSR
jgi:hypothetical protein